jgi:hypothetical protein
MPIPFPARKLSVFALLSLIDFGLTYHLFCTGGGAVYESNPVAAWVLAHLGWLGLATFKGAMVAVTAALAVLIFLRHPLAGTRVLSFGCAALVAVVLYSGFIFVSMRRRDPDAEAARLEERSRHLDLARQRGLEYRDVLAVVRGDVRAGRCTLGDAVARLAATDQGRDERWLRHFQAYYPGHGDRECLALSIINQFEAEAGELPAAAARLRRSLRMQFRALYGRDVPANLGVATGPRSAERRLPIVSLQVR